MELSAPSFFSCALSLTFLSCILFLILKIRKVFRAVDVKILYFFAVLIIIRGYLPFDFYGISLTRTYNSMTIVPVLQEFTNRSFGISKNWQITVWEMLLFFWLSIALLLLVKKIAGYWQYSRKVRMRVNESQNLEMEVYRNAFRKVFPKKVSMFPVIKMKGLSTPAVFGVFHPIILLSDMEYPEEELYCVFLHELLHIKNKDWMLQVLADFLRCVHWWNPVIYHFLYSSLRQLQELMVDQSVIRKMSEKKKEVYFSSLLRTARNMTGSEKITYYAFCGWTEEEKLRQRFYFIAESVPQKKKMSILFLAAFVSLFICSFTFVFEAFNMPEYDENGDKVFYLIKDNSYYLKNGDKYDLYLNGEYFDSVDDLEKEPDDFKDLPVYYDIEEGRRKK